ncbi:MAG: peptidase C15 [Cyanobacteria bacterium J06621_11]
MENGPILITSFQAWRSHQPSNSSDDLIAELKSQNRLPTDIVWIRNVPVSFELAPIRVVNALYRWQPRAVLCCGMAEKRGLLSIEQQAKQGDRTLLTSADIPRLLQKTQLSEISYDAGDYVCNHLYYQVLESIYKYKITATALFIHVPILREESKKIIIEDFYNLLITLSKNM